MGTYTMSDIHGDYVGYLDMLKRINFSAADHLYIIGDVIDRGPKSVEILEHILENQHNIHLIRGNHEDSLLSAIATYGYRGTYYDNGPSHEVIRKLKRRHPAQRLKIIQLLKSTPHFKVLDIAGQPTLLVHAGICTPNPADTPTDYMLRTRDEFLDDETEYPFWIIHGHTPVQFLIDTPIGKIHHYRNRSNVDCGNGFPSGRLGCLRLEDKKEFYLE